MPKKQPLLEDKLQALATRLPRRDAKTIDQALAALLQLCDLDFEVLDLKEALATIEKQRIRDYEEYPEPEMKVVTDRLTAVQSLSEVIDFLNRRAPSKAIKQLHFALSQIAIGGPASPVLQPKKFTGRRPDPPNIVYMKGALAGLMSCKQREGLSRKEAARFVADHISPALASRLSKKRIVPRTIEEWLDRYGGDHPPDDDGGMAYKQWNVSYSTLHKRKLWQTTERLAQLLPG